MVAHHTLILYCLLTSIKQTARGKNIKFKSQGEHIWWMYTKYNYWYMVTTKEKVYDLYIELNDH